MKKVMFFSCIALMAIVSFVSCKDNNGGEDTNAPDILLQETFDEGIPSTWTLIDADGDKQTWWASYGVSFETPPGNGGTDCALSESFSNDMMSALKPDNYMVTPAIEVPNATYTLTWYVAASDPEFPADKYSVYAGTLEGGKFSPIGDALHTEVISSGDFQERSVSLEAYKGQTIYIAFRHYDCTDEFMMKLDDVMIMK